MAKNGDFRCFRDFRDPSARGVLHQPLAGRPRGPLRDPGDRGTPFPGSRGSGRPLQGPLRGSQTPSRGPRRRGFTSTPRGGAPRFPGAAGEGPPGPRGPEGTPPQEEGQGEVPPPLICRGGGGHRRGCPRVGRRLWCSRLRTPQRSSRTAPVWLDRPIPTGLSLYLTGLGLLRPPRGGRAFPRKEEGGPLRPPSGLPPPPGPPGNRGAPARGVDVKPLRRDPPGGPGRAQKAPKTRKNGFFSDFPHFSPFLAILAKNG